MPDRRNPHQRPRSEHREASRRTSVAAMWILMSAFGSACMTGPHNDQELTSWNTPLTFQGYLRTPSDPVQIQAQWPNNEQWYNVGAPVDSSASLTWTIWDQALYRWSTSPMSVPGWAWVRGAAGYEARVRAIHADGGGELATFDENEAMQTRCLGASDGWAEFHRECTSHESGTLALRTSDFVPRVTRGATECSYASDNSCSPCVQDLIASFSAPEIDINHADGSFRIETGNSPGSGHIQGIARLRDRVEPNGRTGRILLSHNLWSHGLRYAEQFVGGWETDTAYIGTDAVTVGREDVQSILNHPSGLQAHGDLVALALEHSGAVASEVGEPAATGYDARVVFFRYPISGGEPELVNTLLLDGSRGEPQQDPTTTEVIITSPHRPSVHVRNDTTFSGASAVGFVTLEDRHVLVAVAGRSHGTRIVWFYRSDRPYVGPETRWEYISGWVPPCARLDGSSLGTCFGGAAGMALVTDCSGDVYMVTMNGSDGQGFPWLDTKYQWIQLFRLEQNGVGDVVPSSPTGTDAIWYQRDNTGQVQLNNPAFRWAGGLYVSEDGAPILFNAERRTNDRVNTYVDGDRYH